MRIVRAGSVARRDDRGAIFEGRVETAPLIDTESRDFFLLEVTFHDGARNRLHVHTTDQLLIVTSGEGIVATETEENAVGAGDIAFIPAKERHWHGARAGSDMTHLSITAHAMTTIVGDDADPYRPPR